MNKRNFQFTENEAKALFVSSSITNVVDAFLEEKFGDDYINFRQDTIQRWLEANRKAAEARASEAQTTKNTSKPKKDEAANEQ